MESSTVAICGLILAVGYLAWRRRNARKYIAILDEWLDAVEEKFEQRDDK